MEKLAIFLIWACLIAPIAAGCGAKLNVEADPEYAQNNIEQDNGHAGLNPKSISSSEYNPHMEPNQSRNQAAADQTSPLPDNSSNEQVSSSSSSSSSQGQTAQQQAGKTETNANKAVHNASTKQTTLTIAELRAKYPNFFKLRGSRQKSAVSLTFDDAPDNEYTVQILDVLKKYKVSATFFVAGNRAEKYPEIVKRIVKEGHTIGNHSYNHPNGLKISDQAFREQIQRTENIIFQLTGRRTALYRPPYGNVNESQIRWLVSKDYRVVNWNVDSLDWKGLGADQIVANVFKDAGKGSIILQHSAGGQGEDLSGTVQALPRIIEKLQEEGLKIVPLSILLDIPDYK